MFRTWWILWFCCSISNDKSFFRHHYSDSVKWMPVDRSGSKLYLKWQQVKQSFGHVYNMVWTSMIPIIWGFNMVKRKSEMIIRPWLIYIFRQGHMNVNQQSVLDKSIHNLHSVLIKLRNVKTARKSCHRHKSNPRPLHLESCSLPLNHIGKELGCTRQSLKH